MKYFALFLCTLFLCANTYAQRGQRGTARGGSIVERLERVLELTDDQKETLTAIQADTRTKMEALRATDFESQEDRRAAFKNVMETQRQAIEGVLTTEQKAQLEALQDERAEKAMTRKAQQKALQEETSAYREQNIQPVMLQQRAKLEQKISESDKAIIASLRTKMEESKQNVERGEGRRKGGKMRGIDEKNKVEREQMKTLLETYKEDINTLFTEVADKAAQWKKDLQEITAKYRPEEEKREGKRGKKRNKGGKRPGPSKFMSAAGFLLMDPALGQNAFQQQPQPFTKLSLFPNPAFNQSNVQYEVLQASQVNIELLDDQGKVLQVLDNKFRDTGTYNLKLDTSSLKDGIYYIAITDQNGKQTQQLVISK